MKKFNPIPLVKAKWHFIIFVLLLVACDQKTANQEGNGEDNSETAFSLSNLKNNKPTPEASVLALAAQYDELKSFTKAAATIHLAEILDREEGQFTVFAPINEAFEAAGIKVDSGSVEHNKRLKDIVLQHVVSQHSSSEDWIEGRTYTALNQGKITISMRGGEDSIVYANDAKIIAADIEGTGGILHIIDKVLIPEDETAEIP